mmetsp:Transcript_4937/g.11170  ORF Transcript_4937/g.11170 Transcript_4937/m.11170 type:complete len:239 (-) Transcript_4937:170-886(-)
MQQMIYPAAPECSKTQIPACGPDNWGEKKFWVIRGPVDDIIRLYLVFMECKVQITASSQTKGDKVWESIEGIERHSYSVVGSWNDFKCEAMTADEETGVWTYSGTLGANVFPNSCSYYELFRIVLDEDTDHAWYPEHALATLGESLVQGPDAGGKENYWLMRNPQAGTNFQIKFDRNALDRRRMVSWMWETPPMYNITGDYLLQLTENGQPENIVTEAPSIPALDLYTHQASKALALD